MAKKRTVRKKPLRTQRNHPADRAKAVRLRPRGAFAISSHLSAQKMTGPMTKQSGAGPLVL